MAVLGVGGRLELRREAAVPCVITDDAVSIGNDSFELLCEGFWPGDHITISGPDGLPIFIDGVPQCWDCVASYDQDALFVAFNRDHIFGNDDDFYKREGNLNNTYWRNNLDFANDNALFYYQGQREGEEEPGNNISGYVCIDALGRVKLYRDRCEARACCGTPLFSWSNGNAVLDFDFIVVSHFGHADYLNAITACFTEIGEYVFNDIAEDDPGNPLFLTSICADAPRYLLPEAGVDEFDNADIQPRPMQMEEYPLWTVQCEVREYTLNLDAPSVDTTGVGEKWGNSVKSLVSGGGSIEFFIDRSCVGEDQADSTQIMRLLLMTQKGAKAHARFFLMSNECETDCNPCPSPGCEQELRGSLWYESDIYITQNAINVRPTEMLAGSAQFVTTGEIVLREGDSNPTNEPPANVPDPVVGDVEVTSTSFANNAAIANGFFYDQGGCPGSNNSPQLSWSTTTAGVTRWRLRCVDRSAGDFVHWSVDNIPAATTSIAQNAAWPAGAVINDTGWNPDPVRNNGWGGPCPPALHEYEIVIQALGANRDVIATGRIAFTATN